jgi:hypothetical protein
MRGGLIHANDLIVATLQAERLRAPVMRPPEILARSCLWS